MTSFVFRQLMMGHRLAYGNFYGQKIWNGAGVVTEIWPLHPERMTVLREGGVRKYLYRKIDGSQRAFRADEIIHIPGFGFDGLMGYGVIELAANSIGLAMSAERYGSRVFANDARPSVVLKHPGVLGKEASDNLISSWNKNYQGSDSAGKAAILEEGMDLTTISFPPEQTQFIETQKWGLLQFARFLHIPPHLIGAVEVSTSWGSGIEQQEQGYVNHTLRPLTRSVEQQFNKDLLLDDERDDYFFEHLFNDLLRGDTASRFTAYASAITNGWITRNEVREKENLNMLDGLDEPLVPLNMTTATVQDEPVSDPEEADVVETDIVDEEPAVTDDNNTDETIRAFVLDAAERIVRREVHEIGDAAKRWKDKPEKFTAWLEEFYKSDHAQFIQRTFAPLKRDVDQIIGVYCLEHGQMVEHAFKNITPIEAVIENWNEIMPELLTKALFGEERE
jgi:HK97 family phage portal protein